MSERAKERLARLQFSEGPRTYAYADHRPCHKDHGDFQKARVGQSDEGIALVRNASFDLAQSGTNYGSVALTGTERRLSANSSVLRSETKEGIDELDFASNPWLT